MNTRNASRPQPRNRVSLSFGLALLICISLACNFSLDLGSEPTQVVNNAPDFAATSAAGQALAQIESTRAAMDVQATQLAQQKQELDAASTQAVVQAQAVPPTQPAPTLPPPPEATDTLPPEPPSATATPDMEDLIQNANILLYEDIAGYYDLTRWVRDDPTLATFDGG